MASRELAKGFTCKVCGADHEYPAYVYAHWREILTTQCECGAEYTIILGVASKIEPPAIRKRRIRPGR